MLLSALSQPNAGVLRDLAPITVGSSRYTAPPDRGFWGLTTDGVVRPSKSYRIFRPRSFESSYGSITERFVEKLKLVSVYSDAVSKTAQVHERVRNADSSIKSLSETVDVVIKTLREFGPDSLLLRSLDAKQVNPMQLATVLRVTYSIRDKIPGWNNALRKAHTAFELAGEDPNDGLFGLI